MIGRTGVPLLLLLLAGCGAGAPDRTVTTGQVPSADGVSIHYDVRGTGEPTLVLVHGWTNSRGIWGEHPETLSRTHRVVSIDLAGHGASASDRQTWGIDAFGDDVVAVVEDLGLDRIVLVGFSMGGAVVIEAAARLGDRVAGVVFIDTLKDPAYRMSDAEIEQTLGAFRANWGDTAFLRAFGFSPDAPDSLVDYVAEMMPPEPREHWFTILQEIRPWMETELEPTLQRIDAPIAAINRSTPPTNIEALKRFDPTFTVDTIDGVGHAGILLRRVEDFDARLLALVERFVSSEAPNQAD